MRLEGARPGEVPARKCARARAHTLYLLDPCILGKMLGANGGKLTFWPPQPQEPLVPWGQAIKPSSLASWLQDALGLKEIR